MIYLIDASVYIFRAYYSLPDTFYDADGDPAHAVYGFASFLMEFLERHSPAHVAACFDESLTTSYRNEIYADYKANRDPPPPDLKKQLKICRDVTDAFGVVGFASDTYEADDLIGTLARAGREQGKTITIMTRDKDLTQLLRDKDTWWDYAANKKLDRKGVQEKFGVTPEHIADLFGLAGDSVDNIPGVRGVGPKTATVLLQAFGDLETLYENLAEVPKLKLRGAKGVRDKLERDRKAAFLSRELARIVCDVDMDTRLDNLTWRGPDLDAVDALCERMNFSKRFRIRAEKLLNT
ncbi:MAG: 5'-3' exonuclease H3TH domain-containing protein [Gammaproteobacteria bacterium]